MGRWLSLALVFCSLAMLGALRADGASITVGEATVVVRQVTGLLEQNLRSLTLDDQVYFNEVIESGDESATEIRFQDDTTLTIGPNTKITLDSVVYDPDPSKAEFIVSITNGVLRLATGTLSSSAYKLNTPVATVGVRGTVVNAGVAGSDDLLRAMLEEMGVEDIGDLTGGTIVWTDEGEYYTHDCSALDIWAVNLGFPDGDADAGFARAREARVELSDGTVLFLGEDDTGELASFEEFLALAKERFEQAGAISVRQVGDEADREIQISDTDHLGRDFLLPQTYLDGGRVTPLRSDATQADTGSARRSWRGTNTATLLLHTAEGTCRDPVVGPPPAAAELAVAQMDQLIIEALEPAAGPPPGPGDDVDTFFADALLENPSQVSPD
jgi:hypothetical protein